MDFKFKQEVVLALVIVFYLVQQGYVISQLNQLPSPIYGGDYYFQLGSITHIMEGGNPLEAPNIQNSQPAYFIVYSYVVASFGSIFGLEPLMAMFLFSQLCIVLFTVSMYFILKYITNSKNIALLSTFLFLPLSAFPILKYTEFTALFLFPLMFMSVYYFYKKQNWLSSIFLGIIAGVLTISHGSAFFVTIAFTLLMFLAFMFHRIIRVDFKEKIFQILPERTNIKKFLPLFLLVISIVFIISLLWWYDPIFTYKGVTLNDNQNWAFEDLSRGDVQIKTLSETVTASFLNFSMINLFILSILSIVGVYFLFFNSSKNRNFVLLCLSVSFILSLHYFITEPIIHTNFSPGKAFQFLIPFSMVLLASLSLDYIEERTKKFFFPVIVCILLITVSIYYFDYENRLQNDIWLKAGNSPLEEHFLDAQEWTLNNTAINEVFLSTKELSFAFNGLTGRKVMTSRRSQNSPFLDIDQIEADSAIILYGNDSVKRRELLRKYNVLYIYWNYYWIQSEITLNQNGEMIGYFDPIIVKDSPKYREYLSKYNVSFIQANTWIDPSIKGPTIRTYDLLIVTPQNYRSFETPWNKDLDKNLIEVWRYEKAGFVYSRIYLIR